MDCFGVRYTGGATDFAQLKRPDRPFKGPLFGASQELFRVGVMWPGREADRLYLGTS
jgi:hypothetical protein